MTPQVVFENWEGIHNSNKRAEALLKAKTYKDLSTICLIPTRGVISVKAAMSWMGLMTPMNQKFTRVPVIKYEVGEAYNLGIEMILNDPELSTWKYILTLEEDNLPPPDGLMKLYESIEEYDVVGGLYWTKGEEGQPMIYGNPDEMPRNYIPQIPKQDTIQRANGLGMGFNLFRLDIFKNPHLTKPWFKTVQEWDPSTGGARALTQDLYFYENASKCGYKFACDTRVKVGHYDINSDIVW